MFSVAMWHAFITCQLLTPVFGISSLSLTHVQRGGPLDYAVTILARKSFKSMIHCASLCERAGWCVAVALCPESGLPLTCDLLAVNVTEDYSSGDKLSNCSVRYSRRRLERLMSCGDASLPNQTLTPCNTTTTTLTTAMTTPTTTECVNSFGGGCHCPKGATNLNCTTFITDCASVLWDSDVYTIQPSSYSTPFQVYCDKTKLTIQRRKDCSNEFFHRDWLEYKDGFGDVSTTCFWLGNEKIKAIVDQDVYTLFVKPSQSILVSISKYKTFKLGSEAEGYKLQYSEFKRYIILDSSEDGFGDCPPDQQLQGMEFQTYDNDNGAGCATNRKSGWWYNSGCAFGDLNQQSSAAWPRNSDAVLTDYDDVSMTISTRWF